MSAKTVRNPVAHVWFRNGGVTDICVFSENGARCNVCNVWAKEWRCACVSNDHSGWVPISQSWVGIVNRSQTWGWGGFQISFKSFHLGPLISVFLDTKLFTRLLVERGDYQVDAEVANQFAAVLDALPTISSFFTTWTRSLVHCSTR